LSIDNGDKIMDEWYICSLLFALMVPRKTHLLLLLLFQPLYSRLIINV
jgi:hypothetical protein